MSQKRWKVGLLGAGFIADSHAKAIQDLNNTNLVAVCDRAKEKADATAEKYGIGSVFTELDEMLASDVEVIHVLVPPDAHHAVTKKILAAGKHVFLEKPMGVSSAECQELVDIADEKQIKLGVNHNFLFLPSYEKLREDAHNGTIGNVDQLTLNWLYPLGLIQFGPYNNWMLKEPQNLFFELGPHLVAYMMDLVGPLDSFDVDAFREIDLPGGSRVYRRWHVHGRAGNSAVDLNLSVTPGFTDRSMSLRGHAANARCDFDRDIYYLDEPSGNGILFDNFFTAKQIAKQVNKNAWSNVTKSIKNTLKKSPAANPFGESIQRSVACFYETINSSLDSRIDGQFGVDVIKACEEITSKADFAPAENVDQVWEVIPPAASPTVLVLGGTGFIGRYLVRKLVDMGLNVRVVTRGMSSGNIALAGLPVELVQGDLDDPDFMDQALHGIEVVYHLAKAIGDNWDDYYKNDVLVTKNIGERALAAGVKRFIYTGTIDSYYSADASDVITSDTSLDTKPHRNHYATSKATCERLLLDMHKEKGLPVVIFRPGVVIGKGCPPAHWGVGMFQSETRVQLWGDGATKLPLVLVDDVAEGLALGLDKEGIEGEAFLLTDEPLLSAREYVDVVSKATGSKLRMEPTPIWKFYAGDVVKEALKHVIKHPNRKIPSYRDWDSRSHRAKYDASKTKQVLGWSPAGTREKLVNEGIIAAVDEFMK